MRNEVLFLLLLLFIFVFSIDARHFSVHVLIAEQVPREMVLTGTSRIQILLHVKLIGLGIWIGHWLIDESLLWHLIGKLFGGMNLNL